MPSRHDANPGLPSRQQILDFLSAVDEPEGFRIVCHLAVPDPFGHLVVRTLLPLDDVLTQALGLGDGGEPRLAPGGAEQGLRHAHRRRPRPRRARDPRS